MGLSHLIMSDEIESLLKEERIFAPGPDFKERAHIRTLEEYKRLYKESVEHPERFWGRLAEEELSWFTKWKSVLAQDFSAIGEEKKPYVKFFEGGELNVSFNCLDRHLEIKGDKAAIIWQGEGEDERRTVTYRELHQEVCKLAHVLKSYGVKKGTTVTIYLPMVPELPIAMLACARLGAIHSVVFSAFSAESLKNRIQDCNASLLITADVSYHAGKAIDLKGKAEQAVNACPSIKNVLVFKRGAGESVMHPGRDRWWHDEVEDLSTTFEPEPCQAEDPLFILYTSGSTGKPKGVMHTNGGYLLHVHTTFKWIFDIKEDDLYWCTADIGWITGHSYVVYGPLSNGATVLMFEGTPTFPNPDRFWKIVSDYKVTIFYTAPTAIRALMRLGDKWPNGHDLSSLRLLGTVGEPINPEAWMWYHRTIGKERCPIVDTWWQTETGGIMITTLPGAMLTKPGAAGLPFFGVVPEIIKEDGNRAQVNEGGSLCLSRAWPGMLRGVYGDPKHELIKKVYFSKVKQRYFTGDGCRMDQDGYFWLMGRIDDVINVSAHRFGTAEIESALVSHKNVAEAAVVGFPHEIKGQGIYCFVTLKNGFEPNERLMDELKQHVRTEISPIATPDKIHFSPALPKTRSGKIMRRILRKIAEGRIEEIGDTSTLADPTVVEQLLKG